MLNKCITFYAVSSNFFDISLKIIEKIYGIGDTCLLLCDNDEEIRFIDSKLWTFSRLAFIPHGSKFSIPPDKAKFCKVWITDKIEFVNNPKILIHNGLNALNNLEIKNFEKVIDIFDKEHLNLAVKRSELYKQMEFEDQKLWIQTENNSWETGNF